MYPPPFGPQGLGAPSKDETEAPNGSNVINSSVEPTREEAAAEKAAQDALYEWHLKRLLIYASEPSIWASIDIIAFETVPLLREALAIKRAVAEISSRFGAKLWWIGFTFPTGNFPQKQFIGGPALSAKMLVESVFSSDEVGSGVGTPDGVGINCTAGAFVGRIVEEMTQGLSSSFSKIGEATTVASGTAVPPWLVLYPNAGLEYDPPTRKWKNVREVGPDWADELLQEVKTGLSGDGKDSVGSGGAGSGSWGGLILGGELSWLFSPDSSAPVPRACLPPSLHGGGSRVSGDGSLIELTINMVDSLVFRSL